MEGVIASSTFEGPDGRYEVRVLEAEGNDGIIEFSFADTVEEWDINQIDYEEEGTIYGGLGDWRERWGDFYWFRYEPDAKPPIISYWGDQVIARQDFASP